MNRTRRMIVAASAIIIASSGAAAAAPILRNVNEPGECDIAVGARWASSYCYEGAGAHRAVIVCKGHHTTSRRSSPWAPILEPSEDARCPVGEQIVAYRVVTRSRLFTRQP